MDTKSFSQQYFIKYVCLRPYSFFYTAKNLPIVTFFSGSQLKPVELDFFKEFFKEFFEKFKNRFAFLNLFRSALRYLQLAGKQEPRGRGHWQLWFLALIKVSSVLWYLHLILCLFFYYSAKNELNTTYLKRFLVIFTILFVSRSKLDL